MNYGDPITPRTRRWLRPVALGATLALGVGCVAAISLTKAGVSESRAAHHPIVSGSAECDGGIDWSIGNSEGWEGGSMSYTSNLGISGTIPNGDGPDTPHSDAANGTTLTLTVSATWTNGVTASDSATVSVPDDCEEPPTTPPTEPPTTPPTTEPPTTPPTTEVPPSTTIPASSSTTSPPTTTPSSSVPDSSVPPPITTTPDTSAAPTTTSPPTPPQTSPPATQPEPYCSRFPNAEGCDDGLPTAEGG